MISGVYEKLICSKRVSNLPVLWCIEVKLSWGFSKECHCVPRSRCMPPHNILTQNRPLNVKHGLYAKRCVNMVANCRAVIW